MFNSRSKNRVCVVFVFVWPVAVDITKMISDREGWGGGWLPHSLFTAFIRCKYHHSVLPPCEGIPLSTA